ncbi:hypothetical protein [Cryptosporangium sp. NPDC051539]|uniref:hypothetical protein n=1 Tax=Cryptosporangium sp. NPDC051539 TaxID=3363962 RepID=UPI00379581E1
MLKRTCACLLVGAVGLGAYSDTASAEDRPPTTCKEGIGCITRVQKPGTSGTETEKRVVSQPRPGGAAGEAAPDEIATTPGEAAEQAVSLLPLRGPRIGIAPDTDGRGLVGLPVWLWTDQTPETWGPLEQTTTVTGIAVSVHAQATSITWEMGDGTAITCDGPGTPYEPAYGNVASPDCGYRYTHPSTSQPDGVYTITGTTDWTVTWQIVGSGDNGVITTSASTETTIRIDELQVVTSQ